MKFNASAARQALAAFSIAATCALACGCSSTPFPAVLAPLPPPPSDVILSPEQVKKAMDNLIFDRDRLCAQAKAEAAPGTPPPDCAATGATPNTGAPPKP